MLYLQHDEETKLGSPTHTEAPLSLERLMSPLNEPRSLLVENRHRTSPPSQRVPQDMKPQDMRHLEVLMSGAEARWLGDMSPEHREGANINEQGTGPMAHGQEDLSRRDEARMRAAAEVEEPSPNFLPTLKCKPELYLSLDPD